MRNSWYQQPWKREGTGQVSYRGNYQTCSGLLSWLKAWSMITCKMRRLVSDLRLRPSQRKRAISDQWAMKCEVALWNSTTQRDCNTKQPGKMSHQQGQDQRWPFASVEKRHYAMESPEGKHKIRNFRTILNHLWTTVCIFPCFFLDPAGKVPSSWIE